MLLHPLSREPVVVWVSGRWSHSPSTKAWWSASIEATPQYTQVQPTFPWLWPLIKGQRKMEYYSLASWNVTTPFLTNKKKLMTILSPWTSQKEAQNEKHSFVCLGILMKSKIGIHIEVCFSYFWTFYCSNNWSFDNNRRPPSIYYSKC